MLDTLENPVAEEDTSETMISLDANDRCDSCGAQAYVVASKDGVPGEVMFCRHHANKHEPALLTQGFALVWDSTAMESLFENRLQGVSH